MNRIMRWTLAMICLAMVSWSWPISAVQWAEPFERPGRSSITRAHIDQFIQQFVLERERVAVVMTLFDEFSAAMSAFGRDRITPTEAHWQTLIEPLERHAARMHGRSIEALERIAVGGDPEDYRILRPQIEAAQNRLDHQRRLREIDLAQLADQQAEMERAFLEDLRAVLNDHERASWWDYVDWLDRARYSAYQSAYPEVNLDLAALLDEAAPTAAELTDREGFESALREYERARAAALREVASRHIDAARHEVRRQLQRAEALRQVVMEDEEGNVIATEPVDLVTAIGIEFRAVEPLQAEQRLRDLNRSFRPRLAAYLTPDAADRYRALIARALHARWWEPSQSKAFQLAAAIDRQISLNEDEREVVQLWLDELDRNRMRLAERLHELTNEAMDIESDVDHEPERIDRINRQRLRLQYEGLAMDNACLDGLWNQLTSAQQAQLARPAAWVIAEVEPDE